jgi:hypothetical protein
MASPQVFRHDGIASPNIYQAGRRPAIKAAEFFNTTGPTGGKRRLHVIVSNYFSEKELYEGHQMFVMAKNAWRTGWQSPNPIFIALCKRQ